MLGLLATRGSGDDGSSAAVDGALAKINRVLPSTLRRQVEALEETLGFTATRGATPADAPRCSCSRTRSAAAAGSAPPTASFGGEETERELSPHGLVVHSGRWYLAAHDHLRDDLRTFRVDRMSRRRSWRRRGGRAARRDSTPSLT